MKDKPDIFPIDAHAQYYLGFELGQAKQHFLGSVPLYHFLISHSFSDETYGQL